MPLCGRIFSSNKKGGTEELGKNERKILRKILGPKKYGREWRRKETIKNYILKPKDFQIPSEKEGLHSTDTWSE